METTKKMALTIAWDGEYCSRECPFLDANDWSQVAQCVLHKEALRPSMEAYTSNVENWYSCEGCHKMRSRT